MANRKPGNTILKNNPSFKHSNF